MLTYIEPCGWCSSSISSRKSPSNVDKSSEPCPNLSTSLISTNDSLSFSTTNSSTFYEKRHRASTCIIRSTYNNPTDYHTAKRIDQLHERMDDIQIKNFLKFINYHLSLGKDKDDIHINDLIKDLSNGHVLINLIEILSKTKLKREYGRTRFHSLTNVQYVLDYLKQRVHYINISPHDIVSGNRKQILALLWIIMKTFDFPGFRLENKNCFLEKTLLGFGQDRSILLKWLNNILKKSLNTNLNSIKDFYLQTWINGYYLTIIIKYLLPISLNYLSIKTFDFINELDQLNPFDTKRFHICLNLSNYCFNTITIIDYNDKTEKCLFKYFTELQLHVSNILKTNHVGKLIQTNPYTKQILETVNQINENAEEGINNDEEYLICIEDEKSRCENIQDVKSDSEMVNGHSEISKDESSEEIIEKAQEQVNDLEETEQIINKNQDIEQSVVIDNEPEQIDETNVESQEQSTAEVQVQNENTLLQKQIEQIEEKKDSVVIDEHVESSTITEEPIERVVFEKEPDQFTIEESQEQQTNTSIETEKSESGVPVIDDVEQLINTNQEQEVVTPENNIKSLEQPLIINIENQPTITIDEEVKPSIVIEEEQHSITNDEDNQFTVDHQNNKEPIENNSQLTDNGRLEQSTSEESLESVLSNDEYTIIPFTNNHLNTTNEENVQNIKEDINNENSIVSNGELETPVVHEQITNENEKLDQSLAPIEESEPVIENSEPLETPPCIVSNGSIEQSPVTIVQNTQPSASTESPQVITSVEINHPIITNKKLEKPIVIEIQQPVPLNEEINDLTTIDNSNQPLPLIEEIQSPIISNGEPVQSIVYSKEPEQREVIPEVPTVTITTKTIPNGTKYADIAKKTSPKVNNTSTNSFKKKEYSNVSNKQTNSPIISSEKSKQTVITAQVPEQGPLINPNKQSEQSEVSLEKSEQSTIIITEEPSASVISNEQTKKSSPKSKKSKRSNGKKGKNKTLQQSVINNEHHEEQEEEIETPAPTPSVISVIENSTTTPETPIPSETSSNTNVTRSRKNKKKKSPTSTPVLSPSTPIPSASNRNYILVMKEWLRDRKPVVFKYVFILVCLCLCIIIVLSHK